MLYQASSSIKGIPKKGFSKNDVLLQDANNLEVKYIKQTLYILWKIVFVLNFLGTMVLLYPFFYIALSRKPWYKYAFVLQKFWARLLTMPMGIFFSIKRKGTQKKGQTYIYCANHSSYIDIIMCYCTISDYFIFMGKQELQKAPLFNIFFRDMNILVNRKSNFGSHKALQTAGERLDMGQSLIIFPEGTISKEAPKLRPFKYGAFKLAIEKQLPIIPITYLNNFMLLQDKAFLKGNGRPGISRVIVHEAVETKGLTIDDVEMLKNKVEQIIRQPLLEYYSFLN